MSTLLFLTVVLSNALATPILPDPDATSNTQTFLTTYRTLLLESLWHIWSFIKEQAEIIEGYLPTSVSSLLKVVIKFLGDEGGTNTQVVISSIVICFMCAWISAPPRLRYKRAGWSRWEMFRLRCFRMSAAVLAPDDGAMSLGEYVGYARASLATINKKLFYDDAEKKWTEAHVHFACLGGFELLELDNTVRPLILSELIMLALNKEIEVSQLLISKEDIRRRTKGGSWKLTKFFVFLAFVWFIFKWRNSREFDLLRELTLMYTFFTLFSCYISRHKRVQLLDPFVIQKLRRDSPVDVQKEGEREEDQREGETIKEEILDTSLNEGHLVVPHSPSHFDFDPEKAQPLLPEVPKSEETPDNPSKHEERSSSSPKKSMLERIRHDWETSHGLSGIFSFLWIIIFVYLLEALLYVVLFVFFLAALACCMVVATKNHIWKSMIDPTRLPITLGNTITCWVINSYWGHLIYRTQWVQFKSEYERQLWIWSTWFIVLQPVIFLPFLNRRLRMRFGNVFGQKISVLYSLLYFFARLTMFFLPFYYAFRR